MLIFNFDVFFLLTVTVTPTDTSLPISTFNTTTTRAKMSQKTFVDARSLRDAINTADSAIRKAVVDGSLLEVLGGLKSVIVGDIF